MARRILALDTSTSWGSVALLEHGEGEPELVAEIGARIDGSQAGDLLPRIDAILALVGWDRGSLDLFVACRGPGKFTGVRIGLGTVRGLSLATDRPATAVGTLPALAEAFGPADRPRIPLIGAGRVEFYMACYDAAGSPPAELVAPRLVAPDEIPAATPSGEGVCFGPGAPTEYGGRLVHGRAPRGVAAAAGRLAAMAPPGESEDSLAPLYVRPPDALVGRRR